MHFLSKLDDLYSITRTQKKIWMPWLTSVIPVFLCQDRRQRQELPGIYVGQLA